MGKIKQLFCKHEFKSMDDERYIGTTLDYSMRIVPEYECTYVCHKCGKKKKWQYIYLGNGMLGWNDYLNKVKDGK